MKTPSHHDDMGNRGFLVGKLWRLETRQHRCCRPLLTFVLLLTLNANKGFNMCRVLLLNYYKLQ